jgi:TetR/AcrR family transcriptional regulator, regulator of mycofactocin system
MVTTVNVVETPGGDVGSGDAGRGDAGRGDPGRGELGRRERKKQETRQALEAAALRLFETQGYESTTVEEIAEAADVAVRTFFRYFQSKQDVLFGEVGQDLFGRLAAQLAKRPETESPVEAVGAAFREMYQDAPDQQRQILDRMRALDRSPKLAGPYHLLFQRLHDLIAEFVGERLSVSPVDLYPQLVAFEAIGGARPLVDLRDEAYAALTAGLRTPPGSRTKALDGSGTGTRVPRTHPRP